MGSTWGNLGCWDNGVHRYAQACEALAVKVAQAAGVSPGAEVLSLACGAGDELALWRNHFGAAYVMGVEAQVAWARRPDVLHGSATDLLALPALEGRQFDQVLCVDAAYHFHPQRAFLQGAWQFLRPGGVLAYCTLVLDKKTRGPGLRACAHLCGVSLTALMSAPQQRQELEAVGYEQVQVQRLDDAVLGGFARFVRAQERWLGWTAWQRAWWRPAITARMIPACRAAGLGYALWAARKPGPGFEAETGFVASTAGADPGSDPGTDPGTDAEADPTAATPPSSLSTAP